MSESRDALRIDRWLFFCRFFKTRSRASAAVRGGHVRVNGERAAPGTRVSEGDRVDVVRERLAYSIVVAAIPSRRGPAAEARACYVEDEESIAARERKTQALKQDRLSMPVTSGRPDKRTRRKLIRRSRG
jgi:ribosome-associated heat shock protein Hsp15